MVPLHLIPPGHLGEHLQRQGVVVLRAQQCQREHELVPGVDEGEQGSDGHGGDRERQEDAEQALCAAGTVEPGGFLQIMGDGVEIALQHHRREGQVERRIGRNERDQAVDEMQLH